MSSIEEISEYTSINQTTSKSSLLESKSPSFSSCNDEGLSEGDFEKKDHSDASSTKVIFYREFTDTSLDDRRFPSLRPGKRRSFCSKIEIKKRMKLLKGFEGSEESSDNFSKLQAKVRLRKVETVTYSSRRQSPEQNPPKFKGRTCARPRSPPQEKPEPVDEAAKYSESIFRVFLQPEGVSVFRRKRQVQNVKPPPRSPSIRLQKRDSDDWHSECSILTDGTLCPGEVAFPSIPHKIILPQDQIRKATSKRSVHWEDEVTFIERSSSSMTSSGGTWENEYLKVHSKNVTDKKMDKKNSNLMNDEKKSRKYKERVRKKLLKKLLQIEVPCVQSDITKSDESSCITLESNVPMPSEQMLPKKLYCHRSKSMGPSIHQGTTDPNHISTLEDSLSPIDNKDLEKGEKKIPLESSNPNRNVKEQLLRKSIRSKRNASGHLKRRRSSPAVVARRKSNDKAEGDSSSSTVFNCNPLKKNEDPTDSNTIDNMSNLKFQCGENSLKNEGDCHYEEVSADEVLNRDLDSMTVAIVKEPSIEGSNSSDIDNTSGKLSNNDPKTLTTETLRECILALQRIKHLSPPSPKSRLEHLGLVQGIQCSLLGMQEILLNDKLCELNKIVKNFDIPFVEDPEREKHLKYSKKIHYEATKSLKGTCHNVYQTDTADTKVEVCPKKRISPKCSKILKSWEHMRKAISDRRDKLWNDLRSKRENTDSSIIDESEGTVMGFNKNSDSLSEAKVNELTMESKFVFVVNEEISETDEIFSKEEISSVCVKSKLNNLKPTQNKNLKKKVSGKTLPSELEQLPESAGKMKNRCEKNQSTGTERVIYLEKPEINEEEIKNKTEVPQGQSHDPLNELKDGISQYEEVSYDSDTSLSVVVAGKREIQCVFKKEKPDQATLLEKNQNSDTTSDYSGSKDVAESATKDPDMSSSKVPYEKVSKESTQIPLEICDKENYVDRLAENFKGRECLTESIVAKRKESIGRLQLRISKELERRPRFDKSRESAGHQSRLSEKSGSSVAYSEVSETRPGSSPSSRESVETIASLARRPPSRKPFFAGSEPTIEKSRNDSFSSQFQVSSAPERSDNPIRRGSNEAVHRQPPPPRMYSTLKDQRPPSSAGKRLTVNEKLESAIRTLNNRCSRSGMDNTNNITIRSPSRGGSADSVKRTTPEIRQRESVKLERKKSLEYAKISEEKLKSTSGAKTPKRFEISKHRGPEVSQTLPKIISNSEPASSVKNQNNISGRRKSLIEERLKNYVPPWDRLNLKPSTGIRNKNVNDQSKESKISEKSLKCAGRSLSNPQTRSKNSFDLKINRNVGGGSSPCSPVRTQVPQRPPVRSRKSILRLLQ